jgi:single-stranded DNA-binding protein
MKSFKVHAHGNLAADPVKEMRGTTAIVKFTLIGNDYINKETGTRPVSVMFSAFGNTGDSVLRRRKGDQLIVEGHIETNSAQVDGETRYYTNFIADEVAYGAPGALTRERLAANG